VDFLIGFESAIAQHPAVLDVAVIAVPHLHWGERPLACVVLRPVAEPAVAAEHRSEPTGAELAEFPAGSVASWQIPQDWKWLSELPRTGIGKVDKTRLRRLYGEAPAAGD
jgi:fatty-acyl-CoA synthase